MTLVEALPWALSVTTLATNWLAGSKWTYTYAIGLANQGLWFWWIFLSGTYGLLVLNLALTVIYFRNHLRWIRDARIERDNRAIDAIRGKIT